jgi:HK97 gp10 family phage protein
VTEIKGMRELKKAFQTLAKTADKNQEVALKLAANAYKNDVQAGAPYDTGTLRRSIHIEPFNGVIKDGQNRTYVVVGTDLPYARRLEYGFYQGDGFTGGVDSLGRQYNQAPRPYFRPPLDNNFEKYQKIYLAAMGDILA